MEMKTPEVCTKASQEIGNENSNEIQCTDRKNPLELSLVIKCVLQYLDFEDLKNCRLISTEWSSVGLLNLKHRSKIVLAKGRSQGKFYDRSPASFMKLFPFSEDSVPFTAFKIASCKECPWVWDVTELNEFLDQQKKTIRQLELENVYLANGNGIISDGFDISPWVVDSPITKPDAKFNTKLSIWCHKGTIFTAKLSSLVNIQELHLDKCKVYLEDGLKICAKNVKLFNVQFLRYEQKLPEISVNDVVDLSKVQKLRLYCEPEVVPYNEFDDFIEEFLNPNPGNENEYKDTFLSLEMGRNDLALKYLYFDNIKLINWETCTWIIEKLSLKRRYPLVDKHLEINELYFNVTKHNWPAVDFSSLPRSLRKLSYHQTCFNFNGAEATCSETVVLPNLESLYLNSNVNSMFPHFLNCPLVDLHLEGNDGLVLNLDLIPKTVKNLKLKDIKILQKKDGEPLFVEKLVLDYLVNNFEHVFKGFKTNTLVIICRVIIGYRYNEDVKELVTFLKSDKNCVDTGQRFYIGTYLVFYYRILSHNEIYPDDLVDRESECYVFEHQKGKAISTVEFQKMQQVGPNENG